MKERDTMKVSHLVLVVACAVAGGAPFGDVSIFHGAPGGAGNVRIHAAGSIQSPALLQGIVFLPIDFVGRTRLDELASDRPKLREDVPGAGRLVLPQSMGSLYHYRRDTSAGAAFGLMLVGSNGVARSVWEEPGTGPGAALDPMVPRVAISPDGNGVLLATISAAGGNLIDIDLSTGVARDRTPHLPPQSFSLCGLALTETWGVAVRSSGVLRFLREDTATAGAVPFPGGAPLWFGGDVVLSGDGLVAATTAGSGLTAAHIYSFGPVGSAHRVTPTPSHLAGAGFLPESANGPLLALSYAGDSCAWITEGSAREAWLTSTAAHASSLVQITNDAEFSYTLDEIGVLFFLATGRLILAAGSREDGPMGMEKVEVFRVTAPAPGQTGSTQNMSMTSPYSGGPFDYGTIEPVEIIRMPGSDNLLILDDANDQLLGVPTNYSGSILLADQVERIALLERSGGWVLLVLERDSSLDICRLPVSKSLSMETIASLPEGLEARHPAVDSKGSTGFVIADASGEWLSRFFLPKDEAKLFETNPGSYGPTLGFDALGNLIFSVEGASSTTFYAWPRSRVDSSIETFVSDLALAGDADADADEEDPAVPSVSPSAPKSKLSPNMSPAVGTMVGPVGSLVFPITIDEGFYLPGAGG